jgi:hypothetical protein
VVTWGLRGRSSCAILPANSILCLQEIKAPLETCKEPVESVQGPTCDGLGAVEGMGGTGCGGQRAGEGTMMWK